MGSTLSDSLRAHRSPSRCAARKRDSGSPDNGEQEESRRGREARLFGVDVWRKIGQLVKRFKSKYSRPTYPRRK